MNTTLFRRAARLIMVLGVVLSLLLAGAAPSDFSGLRPTSSQSSK